MNTDIYYFSGTGNSLVVARDLARELGGRLLPIGAGTDHDPPASEAERVGIVFPVYYAGLPPVVRRFAEQLQVPAESYLFGVCTYGGGVGYALRDLRCSLSTRSLELSAAFGVHMPQNAFYKPWENREKINRARKHKVRTICSWIAAGKRGMPFSTRLAYLLLLPVNRWARPKFRKGLAEISGLSPDAGDDELIRNADLGFSVLEDCNGCGICVRVCPVDNIRLNELRPMWLHRCENCLACYSWCPQQAITTLLVQSGYRYHHPEVSAGALSIARGSAPE